MKDGKIDYIKKIYYNRFSKHIKKDSNCELVPFVGSYFAFEENSELILTGNFRTNFRCNSKYENSTLVRLDKDSKIIVNGKFSIFYGGDICCFKDSCLELGSGFCNSNVKIRCAKSIKIGNNVKISHDVTIMDTDAHSIEYEGYEQTKPIVIGDNVWIGTRVTILKGVRIGNGAIIGAGSVVTRDIPENCIAVGVPARIIRENVSWR